MLGAKLGQLRTELNRSQRKVAKDVQITYSTYNRYELGKRQPDIYTINKLADYYDVPISFLMERKPFDQWDHINKNREAILSEFKEKGGTAPNVDPRNWMINEYVKFISIILKEVTTEDNAIQYVFYDELLQNMDRYSKTPTKVEVNERSGSIFESVMNLSTKRRNELLRILDLLELEQKLSE